MREKEESSKKRGLKEKEKRLENKKERKVLDAFFLDDERKGMA